MSDAVPAKWDATKIQSQRDKRAIVTGANSGIGFVSALELARHGADVALACRSENKGKNAVKKIEEQLQLSPDAGRVEFRKLDVSSLASMQAFAEEFKSKEDRVDLLINNAGIMAVPHALTVDGYESQFATNHLGYFALTIHLIQQLQNSASARVVNVSSLAHRQAKMDASEIMTSQDKYNPLAVYERSKLYNMLFTHELNRRFKSSGVSNVVATAAHPGFTATNLADTILDNSNWVMRQIANVVLMLPIAQTSEFGALPTLYAPWGTTTSPTTSSAPVVSVPFVATLQNKSPRRTASQRRTPPRYGRKVSASRRSSSTCKLDIRYFEYNTQKSEMVQR